MSRQVQTYLSIHYKRLGCYSISPHNGRGAASSSSSLEKNNHRRFHRHSRARLLYFQSLDEELKHVFGMSGEIQTTHFSQYLRLMGSSLRLLSWVGTTKVIYPKYMLWNFKWILLFSLFEGRLDRQGTTEFFWNFAKVSYPTFVGLFPRFHVP